MDFRLHKYFKKKSFTAVVPVQNINDHHPEKQVKMIFLKILLINKKFPLIDRIYQMFFHVIIFGCLLLFKNNGQLDFMGKK